MKFWRIVLTNWINVAGTLLGLQISFTIRLAFFDLQENSIDKALVASSILLLYVAALFLIPYLLGLILADYIFFKYLNLGLSTSIKYESISFLILIILPLFEDLPGSMITYFLISFFFIVTQKIRKRMLSKSAR